MSLAMTKILAATEAWLSGVAEGVAGMEMAVEDMLGVVTDALEETGADEIAEDEATEDEASDEVLEMTKTPEVGLLSETVAEEEVSLEAGEEEPGLVKMTDEDPLGVKALEEPEGMESEEVRVTKVVAPGVLVDIRVLTVEAVSIGSEAETEGETEIEVTAKPEVTTAVGLTPVLLGVLEGVTLGGR